ncbi:MAG: hypothetical protein ACXVP0_01210 [Bacteroidia bacterium]
MSEKEHKNEDHFEKLKAKLFDEKEFNTMIIGGPETTKKQGELHDLVLALANDEFGTDEKEECLRLLKEKNGRETLLSGIKKLKNPDKKALLIAACWETGLDFSGDLLFFTSLACDDNFRVAMEAFTVIENAEYSFISEDIKKAGEMVAVKIKEKPETLPLLEDLRDLLDSFSK